MLHPPDMKDERALLADLATSDGHLGALVALCQHALDRSDIEAALRYADRAARIAPDNHHLKILRGTALLRAGWALQAGDCFAQATAAGGPDGEIGLAYVSLALGDVTGAAEIASSLLGRFSFDDFAMLPPLLRRVCDALGPGGVGWAAISADGRVVGAAKEAALRIHGHLVVASAPTGMVLVRKSHKQLRSQTDAANSLHGYIDFRFAPAAADYALPLAISIGGVDLIGSPVRAPAASRIEGFVDRSDDRVFGWVSLSGAPRAPLKIRVIDPTGEALDVDTVMVPAGETQDGLAAGNALRQEFSIDLSQFGLQSKRIEIWGWLADLGTGNQLSGSPLGGEAARASAVPVPPTKRKRGRDRSLHEKRAIDIIVPVYDGAAETLACLESIIASRRLFGDWASACKIVVINDASADVALVAALASLESAGEITLLHNERNVGFPISVNRGFNLHPDRDVVVLNSDTIVFSDWLPRLRAAAYSGPKIGTVTPFSNEASILSYPMRLGDNPAPNATIGAMLDQTAAAVNAGMVIDIPTAVGFCMYIRRDCLDQVGTFDVTYFGRGYGEENDLCMRAFEAGWRNVAAPNIFVTHIGGHSFGASKTMLVIRNTRILNELHPGYDGLVRDFIAADPLASARKNIDAARLLQATSGPSILLVTLGLTGGVARHVQEAAERYAARGLRTLILRPESDEIGMLGQAVLADPFDDTFCNLVFTLPGEFEALLRLLSECAIGTVEIHHFLGLDESIFAIADRLDVPYEVVLHDYSWLCPRVNLVDGRGRYCGLPSDAGICERCVAIGGATIKPDISAAELRRRSSRVLTGAGRVVASCNDVADRFARFVPDAGYEISPWEDQVFFGDPRPRQSAGRIRVAVIGGIGEQKGFDCLLACARDAALRDLPVEFVVVGYSSDDLSLFKTGRVFVTGRYGDAEAVDLIRAQGCDLAFLPSISPETWSYTLTLAWAAGLEVLAFDFGAIAERVRGFGHGHLIPFSADETAVNHAITDFGLALRSGASSGEGLGALAVKQGGHASGSLVASIESAGETGACLVETLIALEPGLYVFSFSEGQGDETGEPPIVKISVSAGFAANAKVDFLGSHDPVENWLTNPGDVVVVRIAGAASSLLIKTMQIAGKEKSAVPVECRRLGHIEDAAKAVLQPDASGSLRTQITAHVQNRGDLPFVGPGWVGCVGERLWNEAFTINPLEGFLPEEIEYKAITGTGFETPWVPGGTMCGTRGSSNPLVGFAIRLRGAAAERYVCRYRGAFLGAAIAGPFRNGAACRSASGRDPLEGIALEIVEKSESAELDAQQTPETSMPDYEIVYGSY